MSIYERCVRRPVTTLMGVLAVMVIGAVVLPRLKIDFLPNIERNVISVRTTYSGAGPQEIERLITEPLERAASTISNVTKVTSTSSEGSSSIRIEFSWGTNMDEAANDVRDKIGQAKRQLPDDADEPIISKFDTSMIPVMQLTVTGSMAAVDLKDYVDDEIQYRFEQIPGVASVDSSGGDTREIRVDVDAAKLASLGIPISSVTSAIKNENQDIPGGYVENGDNEFLVRNRGEFSSVEDIKKVVLAYKGSVPVYIRDVANVFDGIAEKRSDVKLMGRNGVLVEVRKQSGENTVKVADAVREKIAQITNMLPAGTKIGIMRDTSQMVKDSIGALRRDGIGGGIIAIIILFLFLRNIRSTFIISLSVPFSLIATIIVLYFTGLTINIMSLGGLTLGIGMIVDDAIVMLENIYRHRKEGEGRFEAAINGAREVAAAVASSTFTTVCVFGPLVFIGGMSGIFFKELGVTVTVSLLASLVVSMTLVPMLCSRLLKIKVHRHEEAATEERGIYAFYGRVLTVTLRHRLLTIVSVVIVFAGGAYVLLPHIGKEYLPSVDEGQVNVSIELPVGTKLEVVREELARLEKVIIESVPEMVNMYTQAGSGGGYMGGGGGSNTGSLRIVLTPSGERKRSVTDVANDLREKLMPIAHGKLWVMEGGSIMQRILGGGSESRLEIDIRGHDFAAGDKLAQEVSNIISNVPGATNPRVSRTPGKPEINVITDREKAGVLGLSPSEVGDIVNTSIEGAIASQFRRAGNEFDIRVRLRPEDRKQLSSIGNILISSSGAPPVPLRGLATLKQEVGPVQIERTDQERVVSISATYTGDVAPGTVNDEITKHVRELDIPRGFSVEFAGEETERKQAFADMLLALFLAIALVYMVMAIQFESLLHPLLIIFTVPFGLLGVLLALYVTHTNLSLMAYLGVIMLVGIVVKNAIIMIDFINQLREKGIPLEDAVITAGRLRLRPILMTSFATILALIPMASGIGTGSEMHAPLGRAVIGGLTIGTTLTLIFIPTLYALVEAPIEKMRERRQPKLEE